MMNVLPEVVNDVLRLVTHEIEFSDFQRALEMVERREGSKIILRP